MAVDFEISYEIWVYRERLKHQRPRSSCSYSTLWASVEDKSRWAQAQLRWLKTVKFKQPMR